MKPLTPAQRDRRAHLLALKYQRRNAHIVGYGLITLGLGILAHGLYRDGPELLRATQSTVHIIQSRFK
jgi:hypothetical protein